MPTRPKKGSTPHQNAAGRTKAGGQKATTGSGRSPSVAKEAKKASNAPAKAGQTSTAPAKAGQTGKVVVNHEEQASPDEE